MRSGRGVSAVRADRRPGPAYSIPLLLRERASDTPRRRNALAEELNAETAEQIGMDLHPPVTPAIAALEP
jgi:hypothetical protein